MSPERKIDDATRAELLNATVDGVATDVQLEAVTELIEQDATAREELEALRAVADLLRRARAPEAPEGLVADVMAAARAKAPRGWWARCRAGLAAAGWSFGAIREEATNLSRDREYVGSGFGAPTRSREEIMARQQNLFARRAIFAGAGVLAVAALVVYFGGFYPPQNEDAYGTIGAANRYRSEQITGSDVKLDNPEVQAFLQSETFDRIARDPAARAMLGNEALQSALKNDAFRIALSQSSAIKLGDAVKVPESKMPEAIKLGDAVKVPESKMPEAIRLTGGMTSDAMAFTLRNAAVRDLLKNDAAVVALQQSALRDALKSDAWAASLRSDALKSAISNDALVAFTSGAMVQALDSKVVRVSLASDAMAQALSINAWKQALKNDAAIQALTNDALRDALRSDAAQLAFRNDAFVVALSQNALGQLAKDNALSQALNSAAGNQATRSDAAGQ